MSNSFSLGQFNVLDEYWAIDYETNEVAALRLLYRDAQMIQPFALELMRGDIDEKRMHYSVVLERTIDAHTAYQLLEQYRYLFFDDMTEIDPKDHPFIAKFLREKAFANSPRSHGRFGYGRQQGAIMFASSWMRWFRSSPFMWGLGFVVMTALSVFGYVYVIY